MTGLGETEEKDGLVTVCMASQAMLCSAFLFPQDGSGAPLLWKQSSQTATAPKGLFLYFHLPSDITPFSSCSAESRMSACHVGQ